MQFPHRSCLQVETILAFWMSISEMTLFIDTENNTNNNHNILESKTDKNHPIIQNIATTHLWLHAKMKMIQICKGICGGPCYSRLISNNQWNVMEDLTNVTVDDNFVGNTKLISRLKDFVTSNQRGRWRFMTTMIANINDKWKRMNSGTVGDWRTSQGGKIRFRKWLKLRPIGSSPWRYD